MKTMKVILVRHGETKWSKEKRYLGITDISLNRQGMKQAHAISRALENEKINMIYTSVLKRAVATATIISRTGSPDECKTPLLDATPVPCIREDSRLNELSFGDWEGLTFKEITKQDPDVWKKWTPHLSLASGRNKVENFCPPNGESIRELEDRVMSFFQPLLNAEDKPRRYKKRDEKTIVIVSHAGPIKIILLHALGAPLKSFWRLKHDLGAISIVEYFNESPLVVLVNDTSHLCQFIATRSCSYR